MGLSLKDGRAYLNGVRVLRDVVLAGRERAIWQAQKDRASWQPEQIQVRVDAPYTADAYIYVRLRTSDLYITSICNGEGRDRVGFYFKDSAFQKSIEDQVTLGFTGHYNDLGNFESIAELNQGRLDGAIASIARWRQVTKITSRVVDGNGKVIQSEFARHLLTLCLTVSESARFHKVSDTVRNALDGDKNNPLTLGDIDRLVHSWGQQSRLENNGGVAVPNEAKGAPVNEGGSR